MIFSIINGGFLNTVTILFSTHSQVTRKTVDILNDVTCYSACNLHILNNFEFGTKIAYHKSMVALFVVVTFAAFAVLDIVIGPKPNI